MIRIACSPVLRSMLRMAWRLWCRTAYTLVCLNLCIRCRTARTITYFRPQALLTTSGEVESSALASAISVVPPATHRLFDQKLFNVVVYKTLYSSTLCPPPIASWCDVHLQLLDVNYSPAIDTFRLSSGLVIAPVALVPMPVVQYIDVNTSVISLPTRRADLYTINTPAILARLGRHCFRIFRQWWT